jgi:hypothetical protein
VTTETGNAAPVIGQERRPPTENCNPTGRDTDSSAHPGLTGSQQVSFADVVDWAQPYLDAAGDYPLCGSPAWCELPDSDRRKWAAMLDAARHHILRIEVAQAAMAEASRAVSRAADWSQIARESQQIRNFFSEKPWLRRAPATSASGP